MRKRRFDFTPGEQWRPEDGQAIDDLIAWYDTAHGAHLRVTFWLESDQLSGLEQIAWVIMRIRMEKDRQRCDPNFQIVSSVPLTRGSMDLISGLDNRLPRLLFTPWGKTAAALADPQAFLAPFEAVKAERVLDWLPLFHALKPAEELDGLISALGEIPARRGTLMERPPAIEVPFHADVPCGAALCAQIAGLWRAYPDLTRTLGLFGEGYVKHFYHLKELWHLSKLSGRALTDKDFARFHPKIEAAGGNLQAVRQFEESFLADHASLEDYARWRTESKSSVLEFDLDSIADTHECQSPVFLDGEWIIDRQQLLHDDEKEATEPSSARALNEPSSDERTDVTLGG